jgi:predicted small secreted protein
MKILISACVVSIVLLAGCNTVKGVGQDLQKAGEKIEDAAKKK